MKKLLIISVILILIFSNTVMAVNYDYNKINKKLSKVEYYVKKLLKYTNKNIDIHGTEYSPNEDGKIFLQLLDENMTDVNNGYCKLTVYYPNNTKFIDNGTMEILGENGLYYYTFQVPDTEGVYMVSAFCEYPVSHYSEENVSHIADSDNPSSYLSIKDTYIYSNKYTVSCSKGDPINGKLCFYGDIPSGSSVYAYYDTTYFASVPQNATTGWQCVDVDTQVLQDHKDIPTYWGFKCTNCKSSPFAVEYHLAYDNVNTGYSYKYITSWYSTSQTFYIRLNYTCLENVTINESNYVFVKGAGELHVTEKTVSGGGNVTCNITELNQSIWQSNEDIKANITAEINNSETNIINEINTTGENIINTLNISIYDIRDYLYNTIISVRDYIISILNQSIWQSNEDIKANITAEINNSETNIINEINTTGENIINEVYTSCNITENITANITAECNPREMLKYFMAVYGD